MRSKVFHQMLETRGWKYRAFLRYLRFFKYAAFAPLRGEFLESYYVLMRYLDDIVDGDLPLPVGYSNASKYMAEKISFSFNPVNPQDEVDHLMMYCFELAKKFGEDFQEETKDILESLLFDAKRGDKLIIFPQEELARHFHVLDIKGTIRATLKIFKDNPEKYLILEPLGKASRYQYDLEDFQADIAAGYVNISREDCEHFGISEEDLQASSSLKVKAWLRYHAEQGIALLEEHHRLLPTGNFSLFERLVFRFVYENPARKVFLHTLSETKIDTQPITMTEDKLNNGPVGNFHLSKWFLDFTGESGEAMIFYSAKLTWHKWSASYTSWLNYNPGSKVEVKSRFTKVNLPQLRGTQIAWSDSTFGISGIWTSAAPMIEARIYNSEEGFLDWKCYQPASKVRLQLKGHILEGSGYAEQLILTVPPWKIPMDQLRWGRFVSNDNNLVWIELRKESRYKWLWLNSEMISDCTIEDDRVLIPERNLVLLLDRGVTLESEKKISSVVGKVMRYIPGFNKAMPIGFLMADEIKWLSRGELQDNSKTIVSGKAIHELVRFNGH